MGDGHVGDVADVRAQRAEQPARVRGPHLDVAVVGTREEAGVGAVEEQRVHGVAVADEGGEVVEAGDFEGGKVVEEMGGAEGDGSGGEMFAQQQADCAVGGFKTMQRRGGMRKKTRRRRRSRRLN